MKKFFPAIALTSLFALMLVIQMIFNGPESSAEKVSIKEAKYSSYETIFESMKLQTTKGTVVSAEKLKGKVVILNFWASWCRPCVSEFATLNKLIQKVNSKDLVVIGINNDDEYPEKEIKKIEKKYKLKFESVNDMKFNVTNKFRIQKIPASIVFKDGKVIFFSNEEFDFVEESFVYKITKALESKSQK